MQNKPIDQIQQLFSSWTNLIITRI